MDYLIAFFVGSALIFFELASKYHGTEKQALINAWAFIYLAIHGGFAALILYLINVFDILPYIKSEIVRAIIAGIGWQIIIRIKMLSISIPGIDPREKTEIPLGFEYVYKKLSVFFEREIDAIEEQNTLDLIEEIRKNLDIEEVKKKAILLVQLRETRGKLEEAIAKKDIEYIQEEDDITNILLYTIGISSVKTVKKIFRSAKEIPVKSNKP